MKQAMKIIVFIIALPFICMILLMLMATLTAVIASWA